MVKRTCIVNIIKAKSVRLNSGFGNCSYLAARTLRTLLTGTVVDNSFARNVYETMVGVKNLTDYINPFAKISSLKDDFSRMVDCNTDEVFERRFATVELLLFAMNKKPHFSIFLASGVLRSGIAHYFVIVRGINDVIIFDKYSFSYDNKSNDPKLYLAMYQDLEIAGFIS